MIAVSTTELRSNLRKYLEIAKVQRVIIQCGKNETFELVPGERISEGDRYMSIPQNAAAANEGIREIKEGKGIRVNPQNIWDSI